MKYQAKLIISILILMIFSLNNIYQYTGNLTKQLIFFLIGFIIFIILSKVNKKIIYKSIIGLYIVLNCLLLYLLLFGNEVNGSKAWINIFFFSIQPSEFMKITLILLLSMLAVTNNKYLLKSFIIVLIPSILTFLEPDTGNVIFYFIIFFSIIFYKSNYYKKIIKYGIFVILFLASFILLYFFKQDIFVNIFGNSFFYRMDRIVLLFTSSSYQLNIALINMGSSFLGGIKDIISIPEATTDFAFALLVSLTGFLGTLIYLIVNIYLNFLILKKGKNSSLLMEYIVFSFMMMKICQESIHICMNIGLFPITGITLPFISYGGSSLISYFIMLGIISNSYKDNNLDKVNKVDMD